MRTSVVLCAVLVSCSVPSTGGNGGGGGSGAFVRPRGAASNPGMVICNLVPAGQLTITAKSLREARKDLNKSTVTDGAVTTPVGEADCVLVRHTVEKGLAVKTELIVLFGAASVTDPKTGEIWHYAKENRRASWELNADHTVEKGGVDADGDGFDEIQTEVTYAQGVFAGRAISVFDNVSHQLKERRTTLKTGADAVEHRVETFVAGTLDQSATTTAGLVWNDPNAPCFTTQPRVEKNISDELRTRMEEEMGTALIDGIACLEKLGGPALSMKLQLLQQYLQFQPIELRGFYGGGTAAGNVTGALRPGTQLVIEVNTGLYDEAGCMDATERKGTMFHELLHSVFGPHTYEREYQTGAPNDRDLLRDRYVDVVSSCESACFGMASKTQCACARCLRAIDPKATVCDERCKSFSTCTLVDPNDSTKFILGPAVGAVHVGGDKKGTWFKTMADCKMANASGCQSFSLSCKKDSE